MTGLIDDTADYWKAKDVKIRQWLDDDNGRYGFRIRLKFHEEDDPQDFFVTARKHMRTPLGAMKKLVAQADARDALLLVRVGDERGAPAFYVYHPKTLLLYGRDNTAADHRDQRGEKWVDFHPQWGCSLWDYAERRAIPLHPDEDPDPPLPDDEDGADQSDQSPKGVTDYGG